MSRLTIVPREEVLDCWHRDDGVSSSIEPLTDLREQYYVDGNMFDDVTQHANTERPTLT